MADDLKRVGLVFKADGAVDFKKTLKEVGDASNENYATFKNLKSQYDKNTTAVEKLTNQQNYLKSQTDVYSDKVSVLEKELSELESAEKRNETAISKKRTQLLNAQTTLNNYNKGLEDTTKELAKASDKLVQMAEKMDKVGSKSKDVGTNLSKNVTAPIVAMGTASVAAWVKMDEAYDNIASGSGALGEDLQELYDVYDNVFSNMPSSAMDVSTAIADLNTRFGMTGETLEQASEDFLKFARVNNTDVSSSISLVSRAMGDAGIDASEYGNLLDALTVASQNSGISIDTLAGMITKYGAPMRALGYDTQESIAIFASWEKAGVNTEIAFSGMKTAISNWSAAGKDAKEEFQKTIDTIAACPDIASATTLAIETFGSKAGPDLADAIQGGRFSIEEMMATLEDCSGSVEASYDEMTSANDTAKVAFNNLSLIIADLGAVIMEVLAPILESLVEILKGVKEWFDNLDEGTKTAIVVVGLLVAAIGPLLVIFGTVCSAISSVIMFFTLVSGTIVGPVMLAIAAIIAILVILIRYWDDIVSFGKKAWAGIENTFSNAANWFFNTVVNPIMNTFNSLWNGIKSAASSAWNNILSLFSNGGQIFSGVVNGIANVFRNIVNNIISGMNNVISVPFNTINGILNTIRNMSFLGISPFSGIGSISVPRIPMLATGGNLLNGSAIVGEAGAELLTQKGNMTTVTPLTKSGGANQTDLINYEKLAEVLLAVLMKWNPYFVFDKREFGKLIWEVVNG